MKNNWTRVLKADNKYNYMLLDRLKKDCEYFLKHPNTKHLWAGDIKQQIDKMLELYNSLDPKPEWITKEDINNYHKQMLEASDLKQASANKKVASDTKQIGRWLLKVVKNGKTTNRGDDDFTNNGKGGGDAYDIIEIYDTKQDKNKFTQYGQFVSSYYVSTFLDIKNGLNMQGDIPEWTMSATEVKEAQEWLKSLYLNGTPRDFLDDTMEEFRRNMKSANKKVKSFNLKDIITKIKDKYKKLSDIGSWSDAEWFEKGEYAYIYIPINQFDLRVNITTGEIDEEAAEALQELNGQKVEIIKIKATTKGQYGPATSDGKPTRVDVRFEDGQIWDDVDTEWLKHKPFGEDEEDRKVESKLDNLYDLSIELGEEVIERISELMDSGFESEEIVDMVSNEYDCEPAQIQAVIDEVEYESNISEEEYFDKEVDTAVEEAARILKGE